MAAAMRVSDEWSPRLHQRRYAVAGPPAALLLTPMGCVTWLNRQVNMKVGPG